MWDVRLGIADFGCRIADLEFGIWDLELRIGIWNCGLGIADCGFGIWDLEFGIWNCRMWDVRNGPVIVIYDIAGTMDGLIHFCKH